MLIIRRLHYDTCVEPMHRLLESNCEEKQQQQSEKIRTLFWPILPTQPNPSLPYPSHPTLPWPTLHYTIYRILPYLYPTQPYFTIPSLNTLVSWPIYLTVSYTLHSPTLPYVPTLPVLILLYSTLPKPYLPYPT